MEVLSSANHICYVPRRFGKRTALMVVQANEIIAQYDQQGYKLTLRQLYYQFVARGLLSNTPLSYKRLGEVISQARLAGLISWHAIEDRTRNLQRLPSWEGPSDIVTSCASQYMVNTWDYQPRYVEVWVEKEALASVVARAADRWRVPWFCCRGYVSQSEMWAAAQRLAFKSRGGERPVDILHLGDHDPSGIDMTRDIFDRLTLFQVQDLEVERLALNRDQIRKYNPPPNPAKITDSRANAYIDEHGVNSWELDALEPNVLTTLIDKAIEKRVDGTAWNRRISRENRERAQLNNVAKNWSIVTKAIKAYKKKGKGRGTR